MKTYRSAAAGRKKTSRFAAVAMTLTLVTSACGGGKDGATGPAGRGVTWVHVTGTAQQAAANTGYLADNAAQVTITLPAAPAVGDVVQVSGIGAGGWKIAQNAGQAVITKDILGNIGTGWAPRDVARAWSSVASSADGRKLVAGASGDQLFTSTDSGVTWTGRDAARNWQSVASSADGTRQVAVVQSGGQISTPPPIPG